LGRSNEDKKHVTALEPRYFARVRAPGDSATGEALAHLFALKPRNVLAIEVGQEVIKRKQVEMAALRRGFP